MAPILPDESASSIKNILSDRCQKVSEEPFALVGACAAADVPMIMNIMGAIDLDFPQ